MSSGTTPVNIKPSPYFSPARFLDARSKDFGEKIICEDIFGTAIEGKGKRGTSYRRKRSKRSAARRN
jgi:hypothetical protein